LFVSHGQILSFVDSRLVVSMRDLGFFFSLFFLAREIRLFPACTAHYPGLVSAHEQGVLAKDSHPCEARPLECALRRAGQWILLHFVLLHNFGSAHSYRFRAWWSSSSAPVSDPVSATAGFFVCAMIQVLAG
jgi:hypothetical protein